MDFERAFGRVEDLVRQTLVDIATLKTSLKAHERRDEESFRIVSETANTLTNRVQDGLDRQDERRKSLFDSMNIRLDLLDKKFDLMKTQVDEAKGSWRVIAAILAVMSTLMVGLTIAVVNWLLHH